MEAVRTSETSVDNHFTRQYNPEDSSEHHTRRRENLKSHIIRFTFYCISMKIKMCYSVRSLCYNNRLPPVFAVRTPQNYTSTFSFEMWTIRFLKIRSGPHAMFALLILGNNVVRTSERGFLLYHYFSTLCMKKGNINLNNVTQNIYNGQFSSM
jgi:hypothetical protein